MTVRHVQEAGGWTGLWVLTPGKKIQRTEGWLGKQAAKRCPLEPEGLSVLKPKKAKGTQGLQRTQLQWRGGRLPLACVPWTRHGQRESASTQAVLTMSSPEWGHMSWEQLGHALLKLEAAERVRSICQIHSFTSRRCKKKWAQWWAWAVSEQPTPALQQVRAADERHWVSVLPPASLSSLSSSLPKAQGPEATLERCMGTGGEVPAEPTRRKLTPSHFPTTCLVWAWGWRETLPLREVQIFEYYLHDMF